MIMGRKIVSMFSIVLMSAAFLSACGKMTIHTLLVMDPAATNTLTLSLPASMGGTAVSNLVGNVDTIVTVDTANLLSTQGVSATVTVTSFAAAGTSIMLGSNPSDTLCTYIPTGSTAGGIAYLRPLIYKDASFKLTIPTETKSVSKIVQALMPPIPLTLNIDAKVTMDLTGLINLMLNGTGLNIHQKLNLTIPAGFPMLGGSAVILDTTLKSTKTKVTDPKLDQCASALKCGNGTVDAGETCDSAIPAGKPGACPISCDDGNACTGDVITGSPTTCNVVCTHTPVVCSALDQCHVAGVCNTTTGVCSNPNKTDGIVCNDGDACTQTDTCFAGLCVGSNPVVCPLADQCHLAGVCDPSSGVCSNPNKIDGTGCNDGNACTQTDICQAGICTGSNPVVCVASDQCHLAGTCSSSTGACSNPNRADGTGCNDGNACTQTDTCQAGVCVGSNPVICKPFGQCDAAGVCDPSSGSCSNTTLADGTACDDGNACTRTDACQSGFCTGSNPVVCNALDQCHTGTCDTSTGMCSNPTKADGTPCNDGNACTQKDVCLSGACTGKLPVVCAALDQCHMAGTCDPTTGACSNPNTADGTDCTGVDKCKPAGCMNGVCELSTYGTGCIDSNTWTLNTEWEIIDGTFAYEENSAIAIDSCGVTYVTGYTLAPFEGEPANAGCENAFITKRDKFGNVQWRKVLATTRDNVSGLFNSSAIGSSGSGISVDNNDNSVYVVGTTNSNIEGQIKISGYWGTDAFVIKFNSLGQKQWLRTLGVEGNYGYYGDIKTGASSIAVDSNSNIYVTGYTSGNLDGQTFTGDTTYYNLFITKYDSSGVKQWTKLYGTGYGKSIAVDVNNNVYVINQKLGLILKLNSSGEVLWTKVISVTTLVNDLVVDRSGNFYVTGETNENLDGVSQGMLLSTSMFVAKYDTNGVLNWVKYLGIPDTQYERPVTGGRSIALDSKSNCYIVGDTTGDLWGIPNPYNQDAFIAKYDTNGAVQWVNLLSMNTWVFAADIAINGCDNNYVVTTDYFTTKFNTVFPYKPDLAITHINSNATKMFHDARPGPYVEFTIKNIGNAVVSLDSIKCSFIATDGRNTPITGDIMVSGYNNPLEPGQTAIGAFYIENYGSWPEGSYSLKVLVDSDNKIDESNEYNNVSDPITFDVLPGKGLSGELWVNNNRNSVGPMMVLFTGGSGSNYEHIKLFYRCGLGHCYPHVGAATYCLLGPEDCPTTESIVLVPFTGESISGVGFYNNDSGTYGTILVSGHFDVDPTAIDEFGNPVHTKLYLQTTRQTTLSGKSGSTELTDDYRRVDINLPIMSLSGNLTMYRNRGSQFVDPGARAWDILDGEISSKIVAIRDLSNDSSTQGKITYSVTNSRGLSATEEVERTVIPADDSDLDGIPDDVERALLQRFRPFYRFTYQGIDGGPEGYAPTDPLYYFTHSTFRQGVNDHDPGNFPVIYSQQTLANNPMTPFVSSDGYDITKTLSKESVCLNVPSEVEHGAPWGDESTPGTVLYSKNVGLFGHVTRAPIDYYRGQVYGDDDFYRLYKIEYWQFFGYNNAYPPVCIHGCCYGNHEGDWTTVQLLYDPDRDKIVQVLHYAHGKEFRFDMPPYLKGEATDLNTRCNPYINGDPGAIDTGVTAFYSTFNGNGGIYDYVEYQGTNYTTNNVELDGVNPERLHNTVVRLYKDTDTGEYSHPIVYIEHGGHEFWPSQYFVISDDVAGTRHYAPQHDGDDTIHWYLTENVPNLGEVDLLQYPVSNYDENYLVIHYNGFWGCYGCMNSPPPGPTLHTEWNFPANCANGWCWDIMDKEN